MANKQKEWKDMTKGEKIGSFVALGVVIVIVWFVGSAIFNSLSGDRKDETTQTTTQGVDNSLPENEQLKQIAENTLTGNNNLDKPYVREVNVTAQTDGGWGVFVEYNADDNVTTSARKKSIEMKMSEVYIALYTSNKNVRNASVAAYSPIQDSYGNESDGVVYKSVLSKVEADKVNFQANESTLKLNILPSAWNTTVLNQDFR